MKRAVFALLVTLWPFAASAETITVGSGEHTGFTRLTFQVGDDFDWAIGRTDNGYELRMDVADLTFDTSKVFSRIPRTRLLNLAPGESDGSLRFETECNCHVNAFIFRPGILVVDLRDGPPKDDSKFEGPLSGNLGLRAEWKPRPRPYEKERYDWLEDMDLAEATDLPVIGLSIETEEEMTSQTDAAQIYLAEQIGRAATQGIVELSVPAHSVKAAPSPQPEHEPEIAEEVSPDVVQKPAAEAHMRLTATTAVDQANGRSHGPDLTAQGEECPDPARFAIASWGDDRPATVQIAEARQKLVGEFDRVDEDSVLRLTRLYLHLGFGAEAMQLIEEMQIENADPALSILAGVLDNTQEAPGVPGKASCASVVALWALLADPQLRASDPIDKGAIMLAFSGLPLHLRQLLGPRLANRFIELHDNPSARKISDMILRAPNQHGPEITLMEAEVALADGHSGAAIDKAETIVSDGGPLAAEATLLLVETSFAERSSLPQGTYDLVSSLVREQKGSALEPRLQRAQVLAAILQNDYRTAFDIAAGLTDHEISVATDQDLWSSLLGHADSETFIAHTIPRPAEVPESLDVIGFAERLLNLGFPEEARAWLPGANSDDPRARLVAANVELSLGEARGSLRLAAGLDGPEADALRGRALERLGDLALAAEAFGRAGDKPAQISALWRSGNLGDLHAEAPEDPRLALAPPSQDDPAALPTEPDKPLAHGRALVEASGQTRALVEALLQTPSPQPSAGY